MKKNSLHNFYLLVILGLFLGCVPRTEIPVSTSSASSFENIKPIAVEFVNHLSVGNYGAAVKLFDPALSNGLLETQLKQAWEGEISQVGTFQQQTGIQTEVVKGLRAVYVTCRFEKETVDMRIFFNTADQIRGMNFSQAKPQNQSEFGIYLLNQEIPIKQFQAADLQSLELQKTPNISMADIISYSKSTHEIELIPSAYQRILDLYKNPGRVSGPPFIICVGGERIYGGAFWTMLSSANYDGVVILQPIQPDGRIIALRLGYPTRADFTGKDPRGDVRILTALDHAGKLK